MLLIITARGPCWYLVASPVTIRPRDSSQQPERNRVWRDLAFRARLRAGQSVRLVQLAGKTIVE